MSFADFTLRIPPYLINPLLKRRQLLAALLQDQIGCRQRRMSILFQHHLQ
jgi:hypothetical protein